MYVLEDLLLIINERGTEEKMSLERNLNITLPRNKVGVLNTKVKS